MRNTVETLDPQTEAQIQNNKTMSDNGNTTQKAPFVKDLEPGNYAWCQCGQSSNQPFCDGSHKGTGFAPVTFKVSEKQKVALCGCKQSGNAPYCDGTHTTL